MFVAHSSNTMRNARPKFAADNDCVVRSVEEIREERRRKEAEERLRKSAAWAEHIEKNRLAAVSAAEQAAAIYRYRAINVRGDWKVPARDIIAEVARRHGVKYGEILGPRGPRSITAVRTEAIREVADARPDLSMVAIGRIFGRDHTTILHALRKTKKEGSGR